MVCYSTEAGFVGVNMAISCDQGFVSAVNVRAPQVLLRKVDVLPSITQCCTTDCHCSLISVVCMWAACVTERRPAEGQNVYCPCQNSDVKGLFCPDVAPSIVFALSVSFLSHIRNPWATQIPVG